MPTMLPTKRLLLAAVCAALPLLSPADADEGLLSRVARNFRRLEAEKYSPERVFLTDEESGGWPGDTEGRTILALVLEQEALGRKARHLDEIMRRLPAHLNERGYMGKVKADEIDEQQLSGNGWLLRALSAYARLEREPVIDARAIARRLARNLFLPCRGKFASYPIDPAFRAGGGGASGTLASRAVAGWRLSTDIGCAFIGLDGLVDAHTLVRDDDLKPVIEEMIARFLEIDLVAIRAQTHASLTALRALLRYDARRFLPEVERRFETYVRFGMTDRFENYNWFARYDTWTEPCAIVDSLLLAHQLHALTGNARYADFERKFLAALVAHQRDNGGFGLQRAFPKGSPRAPEQKTYEAHWCCTMRGGAGLTMAALWQRRAFAIERGDPRPFRIHASPDETPASHALMRELAAEIRRVTGVEATVLGYAPAFAGDVYVSTQPWHAKGAYRYGVSNGVLAFHGADPAATEAALRHFLETRVRPVPTAAGRLDFSDLSVTNGPQWADVREASLAAVRRQRAAERAPEWENELVNSVNVEPARAYSVPLDRPEAALTDDWPETPFVKSLDGLWKFNWCGAPSQRPRDFFKPDFDDRAWPLIKVPSCVELQGYGAPIYTNIRYPHPANPPKTDRDNNPVSSYRTSFTVPPEWAGRNVYLRFEGVYSAYYVWVNGVKVGYSEDSCTAHEFDITRALIPGANCLAVEVYRWCDGAYLEDQDFFRYSGIFRGVQLVSTPKAEIWDFHAAVDLVNGYRDGALDLTVTTRKTPRPVSATLYDAAFRKVCDVAVGARTTITNVIPWSAENPCLYTLVLTNGEDVRAAKIGFRKVEERANGAVWVNGRPVKFKGVNRHDASPENGRSVTRAEMLRDVTLMKRFNIDTVRTSHYPNDPYFYYLCNRYGLYVQAEANVESHGMGYGLKCLASPPSWTEAHVARCRDMVINWRNAPCVFSWSWGNEAGQGPTFDEITRVCRPLDLTLPMQYRQDCERFSWDGPGYPSLDALKGRGRWRKPQFLFEYAHAMGNALGTFADYWDAIYASDSLIGGCVWDWVDQAVWKETDRLGPDGRRVRYLAYGGDHDELNDGNFCCNGIIDAERHVTPKLIEVGHVHRNLVVSRRGDGTLELWNRFSFTRADAFDGSWTLLEDGEPVARGVFAVPPIEPLTRGPLALDVAQNQVKVENNRIAELPNNRIAELPNNRIAELPNRGNNRIAELPNDRMSEINSEIRQFGNSEILQFGNSIILSNSNHEYFLNVAFHLRRDTLWAPKGWIVAQNQVQWGNRGNNRIAEFQNYRIAELPNDRMSEINSEIRKFGNSEILQFGNSIILSNSNATTRAVISKATGTLSELTLAGRTVIQDVGGIVHGPRLTVMRALTDNDAWMRGRAGNPVDTLGYDTIYLSGLTQLTYHPRQVTATTNGVRAVVIVTGAKSAGFVHTADYCLAADGSLTIVNDVRPFGRMPKALPRLGLTAFLEPAFTNMTYYGRGPWENYIDRCSGSFLGVYRSTVAREFVDYIRPQDNGYKSEVRWAAFTDAAGRGVRVAGSVPLFVQALHDTWQDLEFARHRAGQQRFYAKPAPRREVCLNVDLRQTGLGGNSCGPIPEAAYRFPITNETWAVTLSPR